MRASHEESSSKVGFHSVVVAIGVLCLLAGCGKSETDSATSAKPTGGFDPEALELSDPDLVAGRETWMATCTTCHLNGLTGAPKIGDQAAWAPRISQGLETLYSHALNGFIGPEYTEMPAKGGFTELSDDQVKQAVRFMVSASQ